MMEEQKRVIFEAWKGIRGWNAIQTMKAGYPSQYEQYIPDYERLSKDHTIVGIKQMYLDACMIAEGTNFDEVGQTSLKIQDEKLIWKQSWFDETIEVPFEDITICCPKRYDEILTKTYGDWKTPVQADSYHQMLIIDPDTPYAERNDLY